LKAKNGPILQICGEHNPEDISHQNIINSHFSPAECCRTTLWKITNLMLLAG